MTPRMYASVSNNKDMTTLLDPCLPLDAETSSVQDASSISPKYMELLAGFFEDAISEGNLLECQRLYFAGCSLDTNMPNCHGCSPMIKTLLYKQLNILDWLLQCKATTTLKVACKRHKAYIVRWSFLQNFPVSTASLIDFLPNIWRKEAIYSGMAIRLSGP